MFLLLFVGNNNDVCENMKCYYGIYILMIDGECIVVVSWYKLKFVSYCVVEVRIYNFLFFY